MQKFASQSEVIKVKLLTDNAILPMRGTVHAAGFDLSSAYDAIVPAKGKALIKTDIAIAIPENTYARVAPRSGLALKNFIDTGAGVIDFDYRGNVGVILFNHGDSEFAIKRGDRIAQLILERISMAEIESVDELPETARGSGGFGSTGVSSDALPLDHGETDLKRHKIEREVESASSKLVNELLLVEEILDFINDDKRIRLKQLLLTGDHRATAVIKVFQTNANKEQLKENIDILLSS